jgi:hypothetical protein
MVAMKSSKAAADVKKAARRKKDELPIRGDEAAYTIPVTARITGLGRSSIYKMIGTGELKSDVVCGRRLVNGPWLRKRFNVQAEAAA